MLISKRNPNVYIVDVCHISFQFFHNYKLTFKKIKFVAYSSQGSYTGQLFVYFCNWLADVTITNKYIKLTSIFLRYVYSKKQEITGTPYEEMDGKFYVDRNSSLRTIIWKDDDDVYSTATLSKQEFTLNLLKVIICP